MGAKVLTLLQSQSSAEVAFADPPSVVAMEASRCNALGHAKGDLEPWWSILTDDVVISMPVGPFRGDNHGIAAAREIYRAIAAAKPRLIHEAPFRVSHSGATVVVEFEDHGTIAGVAYRNRIAASLDVPGGNIAAYRQYFGHIDPAVVRTMNGKGPHAHD
jgi:ketosteroid isomerase-like protein